MTAKPVPTAAALASGAPEQAAPSKSSTVVLASVVPMRAGAKLTEDGESGIEVSMLGVAGPTLSWV
ncbi:MAG: hypothetical protein U1F43_21665 [Myxococcota bacterium]